MTNAPPGPIRAGLFTPARPHPQRRLHPHRKRRATPHDWFIPKPQAVIGVSRWMADGTLALELRWSEQCP